MKFIFGLVLLITLSPHSAFSSCAYQGGSCMGTCELKGNGAGICKACGVSGGGVKPCICVNPRQIPFGCTSENQLKSSPNDKKLATGLQEEENLGGEASAN